MILIIIAGISINILFGENGIVERAKQAKEQTLITQYKEQIEFIKTETRLKYNNENITIEQLKNELDKENQIYWVNSTQIVTDNEINKIKLITNDRYIFYITKDTIEYKGKSQIDETPPINSKNPIAEEISYTPQDTSWKINNVKDAIDYLKNNLE